MKKVFLVLVLIGLVFTGFSKNIVELAVSAGNFTTLVAAVEKAGLAGVLTGEGPFTVFAPTDEAFAKLPEGTIESRLNDIPALTRILTYHVVPGKYMSTDVVSLEYLKSAEGSAIPIKVEDGKVYVDNAMITAVDTPYPINKSATIEVIQNRIVEHELGEGKSSNR